MREYYVYILSNKSSTLYTGVTNNLERRVHQHKSNLVEGFTKRYNITRLVYFESTDDVTVANSQRKANQGYAQEQKVRTHQNPES
jgi:putative endonuclease